METKKRNNNYGVGYCGSMQLCNRPGKCKSKVRPVLPVTETLSFENSQNALKED